MITKSDLLWTGIFQPLLEIFKNRRKCMNQAIYIYTHGLCSFSQKAVNQRKHTMKVKVKAYFKHNPPSNASLNVPRWSSNVFSKCFRQFFDVILNGWRRLLDIIPNGVTAQFKKAPPTGSPSSPQQDSKIPANLESQNENKEKFKNKHFKRKSTLTSNRDTILKIASGLDFQVSFFKNWVSIRV